MKRRDFIKVIGTSAFAAGFSGCQNDFISSDISQKPNVLLLVAEDLSTDLGCYGNQTVHTPNLDKLAAEGTMFTNAFATASVCSPSRSAFLTGMYQTSIDSHQHRNLDPKPLPEGCRLLSEYFKQQGYFVFNGEADDMSKQGKLDVNFLYDDGVIDGTDWRQRKPNQPFFGMVQFFETHRDFVRDDRNPIDPADVNLPPYYPDHRLSRRDWADYLENIQVLDGKVGKILNRLHRDGVKDTIIVFFGDHGRPMPRAKQFLYEGGIKVPLIIKWQDNLPASSVNNSLVSLIDVIPSCMKLAGIKTPKNTHAVPFFGNDNEREYIIAARDRCGEAADRIRSLRTKKYKYIRNFHPTRPYTLFSAYKEIQYPMLHLMRYLYHRGELNDVQEAFMKPKRPYEELYDLDKDPFEIHNLAENKDYQDVLTDLRGKLDLWMRQTNDGGQTPEDWENEVQWYLKNQKWYNNTLKKRDMVGRDSPKAHIEFWMDKLNIEQ